ncbi:MAG: RIP metalloprotease RseP [Myxococcota bacterium]|jgi:regulator of sigma E protease|nr:RIP metalloprotease RseP [Myxococcota bacterium]
MSFLDYLFAVIPMLGVLIFVHELGHFLVAKWCGVRVLKFSLGFGAPIGFGNMRMRWVRGGTEYVIAWFPLGGFVKMLGEQMQGVQGEEPDYVPDARPDEYLNAKSTMQKLAITFAGPVMNLILPVIAFMGVLAAGLPQRSPVIGTVEAHSPAAEVGLRAGDRIVAIGEEEVTSWDAIAMAIRDHSEAPMPLRVEREGDTELFHVPVEQRSGMDEFGGVIEVGWIGVGHRRLPTLIGVPETTAPAALAGLQSGDRIQRIGETEVEDWEALVNAYGAELVGSQVAVRVERGTPPETEEVEFTIPVESDLAALGLMPAAVLVRSVADEMPAKEAGFEPGDLILAVDGDPIGSFATFAEVVRTSGGRSLDITYARGGETRTVAVAPRERKVPGPFEITGMEQSVYQIGIAHGFPTLSGASHIETILNPLVSIPKATAMTIERATLFLKSLGKLVSGDVGLENVSGPIGIAEVARKSLDMGWLVYLNTMIFISINLGFLNLLPIPILDGGQAVIIIVEGIKRSPISLRSREIVQQIGMTFILMLMGLAFWNDLSRHWGVFVEWLRGTGL